MLDAPATPDSARTRLRLAVLVQWVQAGLALARRVSEDAGRSIADVARTLYRLSQAVRLALALHARLSDPANPLFQPRPARAARTAAAEDRAETGAESPARPALSDARRARLSDNLASDDAILRRPLHEILKVICAALGVTPDWSLWSDKEPSPAGPPSSSPAAPAPVPLLDRLRLARVGGPPWIGPGEPKRALGRLLTQLRTSCAPLALDPLAALASGGFRLAGVPETAPGSAGVLGRTFARHIADAP